MLLIKKKHNSQLIIKQLKGSSMTEGTFLVLHSFE